MNRLMNPEIQNDEMMMEQETPEQRTQSWYELAAVTDGNEEQAGLCKVYNPNQEPEWYLSAANRGDKYACYTLGMMYYWGVSLTQNYTKAAMWFSRAPDLSLADYELAKILRDGIGLEKDQASSDQLFIKAFREFQQQERKRPNSNIELKLAAIYEKGLAGESDLGLAQYWRTLASESNKKLVEETPTSKIIPQGVQGSPFDDFNQVLLSVRQQSQASQSNKKKKEKRIHKEKALPKSGSASGFAPVTGSDMQSFLDMITPSVLDFKHQDYYVCGNTFRCVWAIREYPTSTEDQAILRELGEMDGVTLRIFVRPVSEYEENKIIEKSERRNRHKKNNANGMKQNIEAEEDLNDVQVIVRRMHKTKETLMHSAVFIEIIGKSLKELQDLQQKVIFFCTRTKIVYDRLWLRQKEGFQTVMLTGSNVFRSQFERSLPAGSVANLYPFSYSGKTDPDGMYIGIDVSGTNIIVNFDRRAQDKTNGHILILGNSGEGKSYLLKLLITNFRQAGKKFYILDPDDEYKDLTIGLGGCYIDMMAGRYFINVLEPRLWTLEPVTDEKEDVPPAFRKGTRLSQHIAYLRDFFRCYKDFPTEQLDTLEILLEKLYANFGITDDTDYNKLTSEDYPILSDLFHLAHHELETYQDTGSQLYTKDILRSLTLGLRSICVGSESTFFNGYTNIVSADFIDFSVKGMMDTNENLKNAMFLNIFSYMSHKFLTEGATELAVDELHLFLQNKIAIDYIRSFMKRGRKKDSGVIIASQNVEDLMLPGIVEYTRPLLSIPTHSFLFNPGENCDEADFQRLLSLQQCEYNLIREPNRGFCLFKCGNERYHLHVIAPPYKRELFGDAGGR
ncbi:type IV secretory pathway VirB4 component [Clostridium sp. KNHs216]|nr:type IV secretory pathway VirB4 component [Clostridium sp. KNHs216]